MKKIALSTVAALLLSSSTVYGEWSIAEAWSAAKVRVSTTLEEKKTLEPITFKLLYPTPFYKTETFKWTAVAVVAVVGTGVTIMTGGVTSVPFATTIGGMVAGGGSGAWAAGMATLGGGTLASGGLGMAGGALVIGTMTDLSIAGLTSFLPDNNIKGREYNTIKIPLPKVGSEQTLNTYGLIEELTEKFIEGKINSTLYEKQIYNYYVYALENLNWNNSYDLINGAILAYNLGDFKKSQDFLDKAKNAFSHQSSFIHYQQALLNLVDNYNANIELNSAIAEERTALTPYLLKIQIAIDNNNLAVAKIVVKQGLEYYDDDNFQLNYLGGIISYRQGNYGEAIEFFEDALSNTTMNEIEAESKMMIAKCYKSLGNNLDKADEWYKDAISEVDDNQEYKNKLNNMYWG